jgi:pentatricopeptide repeat protein
MKSIARTGIAWLLLMLCILPAGNAQAENSAQEAEAFFRQKQYKEALALWQKMISEGNTTAGVYYNTGLAESMLNNVPGALLAFEKGLRLHPGNALIKEAIKSERKKIENATIPVEPFFIREWYERLLALLRPGYWTFLGMGLLFAGLVHFLLMMKRTPAKAVVNRKWPVILSTAGLIAVLVGVLGYREIYRDNEAIVNVRCEIRQAPTADSPVMRAIAPGEKVTITDKIGDWYNVNLLNLDAGWIQKENLTPIRIGNE